MQIKQIMTNDVKYIQSDTTLRDAAAAMADLDCGFLPIGDGSGGKLRGVITDRDIVIRGTAQGLDPNKATVDQIKTNDVWYCFEDDALDAAAESMSKRKIYRLIVLNNENEKKITGVISLGDIVRQNEERLAGHIARGIAA